MILTLDPSTEVVRRVHDDDRQPGPWHIIKRKVPNGFNRPQDANKPAWASTFTCICFCGKREDSRVTGYGFQVNGTLEFSTVERVKKVCPTCWPYGGTK